MAFRFFCGLKTVFFLLSTTLFAQHGPTRYNDFELKGQDLIWQHDYQFEENHDNLRASVVEMLKSKFYTFNVVRTADGYSGELHHYKVDCRRYGRTYAHTPRMYWDGEWKGKFLVTLTEAGYHVTVYALYYEQKVQQVKSYTSEKIVKGRYFDAVTVRTKDALRKKEFENLTLMSLSLKDEFDVRNTVPVKR